MFHEFGEEFGNTMGLVEDILTIDLRRQNNRR